MEKIDLFDYMDDDRVDDVDELLNAIFHGGGFPPAKSRATSILGGFLEARLANMGWSPDDLAAKLYLEPHVIHALLNDMLPDEALPDELVARIASAVGYNANTFLIMLGRTPRPPVFIGDDVEETQEAEVVTPDTSLHTQYQEEMDDLLQEVNEILLHQLDSYYSAEIRSNVRTHKRQESIIKHIEMILAKHRADVKFVRDLIEEFKAADFSGEDIGKDLQTLANIKRIIEHIKETI
jgi:plasmid maintenance system antidote protein VapI